MPVRRAVMASRLICCSMPDIFVRVVSVPTSGPKFLCSSMWLTERGFRLAILADRNATPDTSGETRVIFADRAEARMYSMGEQRVWRRALSVTSPRALWVPHYPFPFALKSTRNRDVRYFSTVHDTLHIEDKKLSDQNRAQERVRVGRC